LRTAEGRAVGPGGAAGGPGAGGHGLAWADARVPQKNLGDAVTLPFARLARSGRLIPGCHSLGAWRRQERRRRFLDAESGPLAASPGRLPDRAMAPPSPTPCPSAAPVNRGRHHHKDSRTIYVGIPVGWSTAFPATRARAGTTPRFCPVSPTCTRSSFPQLLVAPAKQPEPCVFRPVHPPGSGPTACRGAFLPTTRGRSPLAAEGRRQPPPSYNDWASPAHPKLRPDRVISRAAGWAPSPPM